LGLEKATKLANSAILSEVGGPNLKLLTVRLNSALYFIGRDEDTFTELSAIDLLSVLIIFHYFHEQSISKNCGYKSFKQFEDENMGSS
jgi:hypothetical protein